MNQSATTPPTNSSQSACAPGFGVMRSWEQGEFLAAKFIMTEAELLDAITASRMDHYVYGLCLDNGAVFYVGKGTGYRALDHIRSAAQEDDQSEKARYIRSIGDRIRYTIFMYCADDVFAKGYEAYLIRGHHDVLTNIAIPSKETILKMCDPVDPFTAEIAALDYIDKILKDGDRECRLAMLSIIEDCPEILPKISDEDLAWVMGTPDGSMARSSIERQLEEIKNGSH